MRDVRGASDYPAKCPILKLFQLTELSFSESPTLHAIKEDRPHQCLVQPHLELKSAHVPPDMFAESDQGGHGFSKARLHFWAVSSGLGE